MDKGFINDLRKYANSLPVSSDGLYDFPNQEVVVPTGGNITMEDIDYPVIGISLETGEQQLMQPGGDYDFEDTQNVLEIPQFQDGGINSEAYSNFLMATTFEQEYLKSKKIRERISKMGLNPDKEIRKLKNDVDNVTLKEGDSSNGAYYIPFINEIVFADDKYSNYNHDTMSHEVGHIFNGVNSGNNDFISDRNTHAKKDTIGRSLQTLRRYIDDKWYSGEGHKTVPGEIVADVHAARRELYSLGYDGRYNNFTNKAYNDMRRTAQNNFDSVSARMFKKIGSPEMKRYNEILNKTRNELTPADEKFLQQYQKDKKKHDDTQKRYIFDIMNKVVSNDKPNQEDIFYAQDGGMIVRREIPPVNMTSLGNYNLGITNVPNAIQLDNYDRPGSSTFQNFDDAVLNEYRDWENLDDFNITTADGRDLLPTKEFGQDENGNYVDMSLNNFFPNGNDFYNRTYLPNNLQEQLDLQKAYQKSRIVKADEIIPETKYTEQKFESDKNFMRDYIKSDDYRNLLSNYYPDAKGEQANRLARLGSVELELMPQKELQALSGQDKLTIGGLVAIGGDNYNGRNIDPSYSAFNINPRELDRKTFSKDEVSKMQEKGAVSRPMNFLDEFKMIVGDGINNKAVNLADKQSNQTGIHELGHFVRNAVSPNQYQNILKRTRNTDQVDKLIELPNGRFAPTDYIRTPTEITSRLDAMRYLLKENGVKDTTKSLELTDKELQKALENPKIKSDVNVQQLINSTNNSQDLLWLLNNIVDNRTKPGQDLRQYLG